MVTKWTLSQKSLKRDKEGHYIYIIKMVNLPTKHMNYKYICIQHYSTQIYEANIDKTERADSNPITIRNFNVPVLIMNTIFRQKVNKTEELKQHYRSNESNRHI